MAFYTRVEVHNARSKWDENQTGGNISRELSSLPCIPIYEFISSPLFFYFPFIARSYSGRNIQPLA